MLDVRSNGVSGSLRIASLMSLLRAWFYVGSFLEFGIQVQVGASSTGIFARVFLVSEQITMALSRTNTSGAMVNWLVVRSNARGKTRQGFYSRCLYFYFTTIIICTMMFNACTYKCARAVPGALIVLRRRNYVVAFMRFVRCDEIVASIFRDRSHDSLYTAIPFLIRLVIRVVIGILIYLDFQIRSEQVSGVERPQCRVT